MTTPWARIAFKVFFGLLGFSAIVTEIATLVERGTFTPANFFSYFTVENNILAAATLLAGAVLTAAGRGPVLDAFRGAVTVYILVVGVGFSILLSGLSDLTFTAVAWDNVVLHYLMPVVMLVDLVADPPSRHLRFRQSLTWLLFPLAYVVYSLVRGALTDWYPYPFLDPSTDSALAVAITVLGLLALTTALIWIVCALTKIGVRRARHSADQELTVTRRRSPAG